MAKEKRKWWLILVVAAFIIYIFLAARPISEETILKPRWISSLESDYPISFGETSAAENETSLPFTLGDRYGYVGDNGKFLISNIRKASPVPVYISISENHWAEYEALPSSIQVMNPMDEEVLSVENAKGYPLFLDKRIFIAGSEQNSITEIGPGGEELWTYVFPRPLPALTPPGARFWRELLTAR